MWCVYKMENFYVIREVYIVTSASEVREFVLKFMLNVRSVRNL